jgi:hypothetical protein
MFGDETSQAAAAIDDSGYHFNSSGRTLSSAASTVLPDTGVVDDVQSIFAILQTVCYSIIFLVGIVGNLLVLALIIQLRSRKQVKYVTIM